MYLYCQLESSSTAEQEEENHSYTQDTGVTMLKPREWHMMLSLRGIAAHVQHGLGDRNPGGV